MKIMPSSTPWVRSKRRSATPGGGGGVRAGLGRNPADAHLLQSLARLEAQVVISAARQLYERGIEANPKIITSDRGAYETRHPDGDASVAREQFQIASSLAAWSVKTWARGRASSSGAG